MEEQVKFEAWAIIELFGKTKLAGKVVEKRLFGADFCEITVPAVGSIPEWRKSYNASAIYAITEVSESEAKRLATSLKSMPVDRWDVQNIIERRIEELVESGELEKKGLPEPLPFGDSENDFDYDGSGIF